MAGEQQGMWWKSCYFEGSAGVPLIVRGPEVAAGARVDSVVSLLDIGPTLVDWGGGEPIPQAEGRSLRGLLADGTAPAGWADEAFMAYGGAHGDAPSAAIRVGRWKLMWYSEVPDLPLLFDVVDDPEERVNRAQDSDCAEIVADLLGRIRARWSADDMAREAERAALRRAAMGRRRPPATHRSTERPRPQDNAFDFEQLPWADELRGEFFE
jgi:choline-sulfatase